MQAGAAEAVAEAVHPGAADADEEAEHPGAPEADAEAVAVAKTTGLQITTSLKKWTHFTKASSIFCGEHLRLQETALLPYPSLKREFQQ